MALEDGATPTGLTISFPELRQYSVLQVSRDRGVPLVLFAAILVLLGLLPALYTSRRKVWVRAEPNGNGTVLKVGGFALQRKPQFDEEFSKLVEAMARAAGDGAVRRGEGAGELGMTDLQWGRLSNDAFNVALFAYVAAMVGYFAYLAFRKHTLWAIARTVATFGLVANVVCVVTRGLAADRVPWGNMYEYSVLLALLVVLGYLVIVEGYYKIRTLGGFALMFAVFTMAIAVSFLYVGPAPLVPALNSYWIKIHVIAAITGSSLFALGGGVLTILFLVQDRRERRQVAALRAQEPPPILGGSVDVDAPPDFSPDADEPATPA